MWQAFFKTCQARLAQCKAWLQGHPYRPLAWFLILYTLAIVGVLWLIRGIFQ